MTTIDEHTIPIESIVLPASRHGSKWIFTPTEGWSDVLYKDDSGRMWTIDFSANGRARVSATGIRIPGSEDIDPLDYAGDRVVIEFDDDAYVFDVPSRIKLIDVRNGTSRSCPDIQRGDLRSHDFEFTLAMRTIWPGSAKERCPRVRSSIFIAVSSAPL